MKKKSIPKDVAIALVILLLLTVLTTVNEIACSRALDGLTEAVEAIEIDGEYSDTSRKVNMLAEKFDTWSFFFSVTVNHDDIGDAKSELIELVEAVEAKDSVAARIAKSRLLGALGELRRLSGFGIDSII